VSRRQHEHQEAHEGGEGRFDQSSITCDYQKQQRQRQQLRQRTRGTLSVHCGEMRLTSSELVTLGTQGGDTSFRISASQSMPLKKG
jgi:hypothetical protein